MPARKTPPTPVDADAAAPFDLGALLAYRLLRLSSAMGALAHQESQEVAGLSLAEYRVLVVLHARGPCGVVALQKALLIDKAWISRTLGGLVGQGMVESEADRGDARRTLYSVTAQGRQAAQALAARALDRQQRFLQGFTQADVGRLQDLLARLEGNVQAAGGQ